MTLKKPERMDLVGSYPLGCLSLPELNIDVTVQIPKSCFMEKDYLDYRYIEKRAIYARALWKHLTQFPEFSSAEISYFRGDLCKPIIRKIGRAVQQECRDRSRMPSSA
eukprot:TRINITY_DN41745_c0_g1_i2.p1 TRINITY_DN41745_c0_g1~~TRINITY_DN41745_c0_g1_i2.p1  ORF type:complete len:108 (-),score=20.05 TRINITY_DN41745_c0_g1_i2:11-334(-)